MDISLLLCFTQARVAHNKHKVFPVPVGLSRAEMLPDLFNVDITFYI